MVQRVEGDPPGAHRGVIAKAIGDEPVRRLMKVTATTTGSTQVLARRSSPPGCRQIDHGVTRASSASKRRSASVRSKAAPATVASGASPRPHRLTAHRLPWASRAAVRRTATRPRRRLPPFRPGRHCNAARDRTRHRAPAARVRPSSRPAPHRQIVGNQHAGKADLAADDLAMTTPGDKSPGRPGRSPV